VGLGPCSTIHDPRSSPQAHKDPEAIAAISEAFDDLLAFLKSKAATGQKAFEKAVNEKLDKEGKKVLGFKKALRFMLES